MGNKEITKAYVKKFVVPVNGEFYYSVQINRIVEKIMMLYSVIAVNYAGQAKKFHCSWSRRKNSFQKLFALIQMNFLCVRRKRTWDSVHRFM